MTKLNNREFPPQYRLICAIHKYGDQGWYLCSTTKWEEAEQWDPYEDPPPDFLQRVDINKLIFSYPHEEPIYLNILHSSPVEVEPTPVEIDVSDLPTEETGPCLSRRPVTNTPCILTTQEHLVNSKWPHHSADHREFW